jgi:hypothetical protein
MHRLKVACIILLRQRSECQAFAANRKIRSWLQSHSVIILMAPLVSATFLCAKSLGSDADQLAVPVFHAIYKRVQNGRSFSSRRGSNSRNNILDCLGRLGVNVMGTAAYLILYFVAAFIVSTAAISLGVFIGVTSAYKSIKRIEAGGGPEPRYTERKTYKPSEQRARQAAGEVRPPAQTVSQPPVSPPFQPPEQPEIQPPVQPPAQPPFEPPEQPPMHPPPEAPRPPTQWK